MNVVEMTVRDQHQVALLDLLQILGSDRVVHNPGIDDDFLPVGAPDLPGPVADPSEADPGIERHAPSLLGARSTHATSERKRRFSHRPKTKTAMPATVQRFGKKSEQGWMKKPSRQMPRSTSVLTCRCSIAFTATSRIRGSSGSH